MLEHSRRRAVGPWRHRAFLVWIVATSAIALYLAVAAPFAEYFHEDLRLVLVVPPISFMLMAVGIWWLVWLATATPRRTQGDDDQKERVTGGNSTPPQK